MPVSLRNISQEISLFFVWEIPVDRKHDDALPQMIASC